MDELTYVVDNTIKEKLNNYECVHNFEHIEKLIEDINNIEYMDEYNKIIEILQKDNLFENEKLEMKYNGDDLHYEKIVLISILEYKIEGLKRIKKYNYSEELENHEKNKRIEMLKKYKTQNLNDILNKLSRLKNIKDKINNEIYNILNEYIESDSEILLLNAYNFDLLNNYLVEVYEKPLNNNKRTFMIKTEYEFIKERIIRTTV